MLEPMLKSMCARRGATRQDEPNQKSAQKKQQPTKKDLVTKQVAKSAVKKYTSTHHDDEKTEIRVPRLTCCKKNLLSFSHIVSANQNVVLGLEDWQPSSQKESFFVGSL